MTRRTSTIVRLAALLAAVFMLAGCQTVQSPVIGLWMQNVGVPLDAGSTRVGDKEGKACATSYAGVFAMGDASVKAAAAAGGITKVETVDAEVTSWIVVGKFCTVVRGS